MSKNLNSGQTSSTAQWDWVYMYYCARVLLGLSEGEFWRLTPRKLNALMSQYTGKTAQSNAEAFEQLLQP